MVSKICYSLICECKEQLGCVTTDNRIEYSKGEDGEHVFFRY